MALAIRNVAGLQTLAQQVIQGDNPNLTDFNPGSLLDILTGVMATAVGEAQRNDLDQFAKVFVETANGPEVTGGPDDLQRLFVDRFGSDFARPAASSSIGVVTFSRPSSTPGPVLIPAGTIVKTPANAQGSSQRFQTIAAVTMVGLAVNASVQAVTPGVAGNVLAGTITALESTLTDTSVIVVNTLPASGGADIASDSVYREFARNLLVSLRGSTLAAVAAKAKTVTGVVQAIPSEQIMTVAPVNPATNAVIGNSFQISRNFLYIADANGTANAALIAAVQSAIRSATAGGVTITVVGAGAVPQDVSLSLVLNGSGPNYAALVQSVQPILNTMAQYIQNLPIGQGFSRSAAKAAILAIWGPAGTNDLADLTLVVPTGDVQITFSQTLIPGVIKTV